jgi:hypothetical protein
MIINWGGIEEEVGGEGGISLEHEGTSNEKKKHII